VRTGLLRVLVVGLIACDTERDSELAQLAIADRFAPLDPLPVLERLHTAPPMGIRMFQLRTSGPWTCTDRPDGVRFERAP
jgi:hypothetical protein